MKNFKLFILMMGFAGAISSCSVATVADDTSSKFAQNDADIQQYLTTNKLTANKTAAGVYYVVTKSNPSGRMVAVGEQMVFHYVATLLNGTVFDSTSVAQNTPVKLIYGISYTAPGAAIADAIGGYLHQGEKASLIIPSSLAFGSNSSSLIPAYSVVKYDVTVLAFNSEIQQIKNYVIANNLTVTDTTATGLRYIRTLDSTGDLVKAGQSITVNYVGKRLDNSQFDAGSFTFTLGGGNVVSGFNDGIAKMKVGEKATIIFPSALGYGKTGNSTINAYTPLRFDVEVVSAK